MSFTTASPLRYPQGEALHGSVASLLDAARANRRLSRKTALVLPVCPKNGVSRFSQNPNCRLSHRTPPPSLAGAILNVLLLKLNGNRIHVSPQTNLLKTKKRFRLAPKTLFSSTVICSVHQGSPESRQTGSPRPRPRKTLRGTRRNSNRRCAEPLPRRGTVSPENC